MALIGDITERGWRYSRTRRLLKPTMISFGIGEPRHKMQHPTVMVACLYLVLLHRVVGWRRNITNSVSVFFRGKSSMAPYATGAELKYNWRDCAPN